jgi:uncharacterized protein (DUF433 family)
MSTRKRSIEHLGADTDPRELPAYTIREAACYLQLPVATLKSWVLGRHYPTKAGRKFFPPVIDLPDKKVGLLSFLNLAEAHVLSAFRRTHEIELRKIRSAMKFARARLEARHPLIDQRFETDGANLFVEKLGLLVDASAQGQIVMDTIRPFFKRLEFSGDMVVRLYPFTRSTIEDSPKSVFIDPRYSFGRPSLARGHVPTAVILDRYQAGESIEALAKDYECEPLDIQEGLRCEIAFHTAA